MDNVNKEKYKEAITALNFVLMDVNKTAKMLGHTPSADYIITSIEMLKKIYEGMIVLTKEENKEDTANGLKIILHRGK